MTAVRHAPARTISVLHWLLVACLVLHGTALRGCRLGEAPLWTDEAESSINALTILTEGVPTGRYLGQPIFENTFVEPWPEHPEYEFKDSSYSHSGLAIYHGWLPLYATAASFWLHGIGPDVADAPPEPRSPAELERRTRAARAPAVLFGVVFLLAIFLAAREAYGADAGLAALAAATVSTSAVVIARQARYYSATLAITALSALVLTRMITRGQRRDFVFGGLLLALLFHTNLLAFVGMVVGLASCAHLLARQSRFLEKMAFLGGVCVVGVLPWVIATGFLDAAANLPPARALLGPDEVVEYVRRRLPFVVVAATTLAWLVSIHVFRSHLPERLIRPFVHARPILLVLAIWTTGAFAAFNLLVPAASYFHSRLSLILLVPAFLFGSVLCAALARLVTHHHSPALAAALFVLILGSTGKATAWWPTSPIGVPALYEVVAHLQGMRVAPGTRIYADTGTALPLAFYTGLPVQNVMPVRRAFLESLPEDVVVVEGPSRSALAGPDVRAHLARIGVEVDDAEGWRLARRVHEAVVEDHLVARGARVHPPLPALPTPQSSLKTLLADQTRRDVAETIASGGNPMFKAFHLDTFTEMWQVFFYRFVDPATRMGPHLNYGSRVRGARARILRGGWAVLHSRGMAAVMADELPGHPDGERSGLRP